MSALEELRAWKRRQDRCNGFSKHKFKDGSDVLEDNYDEIIEALAKPQWQPIKTAPEDKEVLCYDPQWSEEGIDVAENYGEYWQVTGWDTDTTHFNPTHWMPLHKPQTKEKGHA